MPFIVVVRAAVVANIRALHLFTFSENMDFFYRKNMLKVILMHHTFKLYFFQSHFANVDGNQRSIR